jgi:hypothetical protein
MTLKKDNRIVILSDVDCISGYINEGWEEIKSQPKEQKKSERVKKTEGK